jgi:hypothetical protein
MLRLSLYANLLLLAACVALYALWQHDAGENARNDARAAKAEVKTMREESAKRDAIANWYAALRAKLPKAQRSVADAARANPSDCSVSPAVADSLSRSIKEGNAARRATDSLP